MNTTDMTQRTFLKKYTTTSNVDNSYKEYCKFVFYNNMNPHRPKSKLLNNNCILSS